MSKENRFDYSAAVEGGESPRYKQSFIINY